MSKIDQLLDNYSKYISLPWQSELAPAQRVIFCVYNEQDELKFQMKMDEFQIKTEQLNHKWLSIDVSKTFTSWLVEQKYKLKYFENPKLIEPAIKLFEKFLQKEVVKSIDKAAIDENTVVAIHGVGALFGQVKIKQLVELIAPQITGRLLVFFPGTYENDNYRLLNAYDGWNYLAVTITPDKNL